MTRAVSVGVVGLGYWGPNLARNFNQLPNCELRALCDLDLNQLTKLTHLYPSSSCHTSYKELLANTDLDAIAIATPVAHHFRIAKAALLAGKHVLIEKPLAASTNEGEQLIELAKQNCLNLMVGHTFLYSAPIEMIKRIIESGEIGKIRYINSQRLNLGLFKKDLNVVWDLAPHDISIILHLLGQTPDFVNCQGNAHITPGIEDVSNLSLSFKTGQFATIQSSWLEPRKVRQMTIVGTQKMIVYDDIEPMEKIRIYDTRIDHPQRSESFDEFSYPYHYGDCFVPHIEQFEPLRRMCNHFIDGIITGNRPLTTGESGLDVLRVLEASSKSLESNGTAITVAAPIHQHPTKSLTHEHHGSSEKPQQAIYATNRP